eukprot:11409058-Alexandrium_andersonii.AAC.1
MREHPRTSQQAEKTLGEARQSAQRQLSNRAHAMHAQSKAAISRRGGANSAGSSSDAGARNQGCSAPSSAEQQPETRWANAQHASGQVASRVDKPDVDWLMEVNGFVREGRQRDRRQVALGRDGQRH